jgi:hypothetical protein
MAQQASQTATPPPAVEQATPFALEPMPPRPAAPAPDAERDTPPPLEPPDDLGHRKDVIIEFRD